MISAGMEKARNTRQPLRDRCHLHDVRTILEGHGRNFFSFPPC